MANYCRYSLVAVSPKKESLEKLISIMKYKDDEFYIYRCFSAVDEEIDKDNELYTVMIVGDCAWSCERWFESTEDFNDISKTNAHYITLDLLCKKLDIGIELYSVETGNCFQEHYLVNHEGEFIYNESVEYYENWADENGNELVDPIPTGGFDDYEVFASAKEIY
jgi:hypothetical protein